MVVESNLIWVFFSKLFFDSFSNRQKEFIISISKLKLRSTGEVKANIFPFFSNQINLIP